ncbi:MAG: hypothetical protein ACRD6X_09085 [Pyrinomonadaceae bacterium]
MKTQTTLVTFHKLLLVGQKCLPGSEIYVFFNGYPLPRRAVFRGDRYSFPLPIELKEKMIAGNLIADFSYAPFPDDPWLSGQPAQAPTSIVLSERYP